MTDQCHCRGGKVNRALDAPENRGHPRGYAIARLLSGYCQHRLVVGPQGICGGAMAWLNG
jgi:hypothetical protein